MSINNKNNQLLLVLAFFILHGCGGMYYFDLNLDPVETGDQVKIDKILLVEDIDSNESYYSQQIVFRDTPYQVEYFLYKQWAKRPGVIIKDAAIRFYRNSSMFKKVIENHSSIEPDVILKTNIYAMEMVRDNKEWFAHLALDIEVVDRKTEMVILSSSFDRKEKVKGKKARYVPEQISRILKEELIKVAEKIYSNLNPVDH